MSSHIYTEPGLPHASAVDVETTAARQQEDSAAEKCFDATPSRAPHEREFFTDTPRGA